MSELDLIHDSSFEAQFKRIFEVTECKTQTALADFLGIKQPSVSEVKRSQSISTNWLIKLYEKKQINPSWIRTGLGPKIIETSASEAVRAAKAAAVIAVISDIERRPTKECTTDELTAVLIYRALNSTD